MNERSKDKFNPFFYPNFNDFDCIFIVIRLRTVKDERGRRKCDHYSQKSQAEDVKQKEIGIIFVYKS